MHRMSISLIVLNGGSSSGKSTIARSLQTELRDAWLTFGVDTLISAMPSALNATEEGIAFHPDGTITPGAQFRELEAAWMEGIAAMARAGARIIIDDVFLSGPAAQQRWRAALRGLNVLWVGVRCEVGVAEAREAARGDRIVGMARSQALIVHEGIDYDMVVDTTSTDAAACAQEIAARVVEASG
ncbi:MAG: chloramphenicol phosphotransferase CPT [Thermaerobacter sp.]|nr:chloramphenicol phosphotransferase CPT [Thermaerobacter sp.]